MKAAMSPRGGERSPESRAAVRGNPSFVWRAGQERRLRRILDWAPRPLARILVDGCGVGLYVRALQMHVPEVHGVDIEGTYLERARENAAGAHLLLGRGEALPYHDGVFDLVLSHEVLEHVADDRAAAREMVRVLRPGGRAIVFVPNRLYPFETHGIYWRGKYIFGNIPLVNYLPDPVRGHLAPHVRAYTRRGLLSLFRGQPVRVCHLATIFPGYDNLAARLPTLGRWIRRITYGLEATALAGLGLSHFLVVEKVGGNDR